MNEMRSHSLSFTEKSFSSPRTERRNAPPESTASTNLLLTHRDVRPAISSDRSTILVCFRLI
jgi:hypothetical protein